MTTTSPTGRGPFRARLCALTLALAAALGPLASPGMAAPADVTIDLPAQPLDDALRTLAQQQGLQIFYAPALVAGRQAPAVQGRMSPDAALQALLRDTPLRHRHEGGAIVLETAGNPPGARTPVRLTPVTVTASRTQSQLASPVQQTITLERDELDALGVNATDGLASVLAKAVPGMADSSRTITNFGQTLRGRNVLVLVDGIPMNTNRDSARNLAAVNPSTIERVEVLRGSSSIYGAGATGGIVSITTRPVEGDPVIETTVTGVAPLSRLRANGLGAQIQQHVSGAQGDVDYAFDIGARHIGASYDARGRRLAPEPSQGDMFDSRTYNLGGKLGLRIDANQRLQFSASHYNADQDTDYASDPAVGRLAPGAAQAQALRGLELAEQNQIRNTLLNLEYRHADLWGSALSAQLYYRDYFTRFTPADLRNNVNRGNNVDQTMQNTQVLGSRLTIDTPLGSAERSRVQWGVDFHHERSDMPVDVFDPAIYDASEGRVFVKTGELIYMPPLTTRSTGLFAQGEHRFNDQWSMQGGLRYESASARFDDFRPLSQLRVPNPVTVQGGSVRFDALLLNAGIAYAPWRDHEFYATFSQGFQLPDIGLQMRNARPGFNIGSSDLEPVKTDNYELGWRGEFANASSSLALFYTTSRLGEVQSQNNGLILSRTQERIAGIEGSLDLMTDDETWSGGGTVTWMRGRERPENGDWQVMTGYRVPPLKLTAYVQYRPSARWSTRLQATYFASKDFRLDGVQSFGRRETSSYLTLDLLSRFQLSPQDTLTVGIENLLNRQYFPLYSQLLRSNTNTSRLPAPGAVLTVSYQRRW